MIGMMNLACQKFNSYPKSKDFLDHRSEIPQKQKEKIVNAVGSHFGGNEFFLFWLSRNQDFHSFSNVCQAVMK